MLQNNLSNLKRTFLLALTAALLITTAVMAQDQVDLVVHYVEGTPLEGKVSYSVSIFLSALQSSGSAISGLTKDDFKVTEDSKQVEIEELSSSSDLPMSVLARNLP